MTSYISEHKSVSVGVGVSILTTIAGIFSSYLRAHPAYLIAAGIVGAALLTWPLLHSLWFGATTPETKTSNSGVQAGRDNSGHQIHNAPGGILIMGDGNVASSPSKDGNIEVQPSPVEPPKSRLTVSGSDMPILVLRLGQWSVYASGAPSLIVWLENREADEGECCAPIWGIVATVRYRDSNGTALAKIARAYWLNEPGSKVNLGVGDRKAIVLGTAHGSTWKAYENSYEPPIQLGPAFRIPHFPSPKVFELAVDKKLAMDVSIVAIGTGQTLKKFSVEYLDKGDHDKKVTVSETL